jgi:hypothetical protein
LTALAAAASASGAENLSGSQTGSGLIAGGQIGGNYQFGRFLHPDLTNELERTVKHGCSAERRLAVALTIIEPDGD